MKKHLFAISIVALLLNACGPVYVVHQDPPPQAAPPPQEVAPDPAPQEASYQTFYDQLAPYGQWIEDPGYGYVWMPNVGPDFKPYATSGHWVYTDEGWTWNSDYPWGWAAFHYGRWFYQDGYGWMWIPGHEWSPAWVSWRNSPDYYGWAPLGPNVSISFSVGGGYNPPPHYWSFVPHQYVASPQVNNYYVSESRNTTIVNNTTIINNTTVINNNSRTNINNNNSRTNNRSYAGGPSPDDVGRFSGAPLRPVSLRESNAPGERMNGGALAIYRPRINPATAPNANDGGTGSGGGRPAVAPARTQPLNNVRPVNTMRYNNPPGNGQPGGNGQPNGNSPSMGNAPAVGNASPAPGNERTPRYGQPGNNGQPASNGQSVSNGRTGGNGQPGGNGQSGNNGQSAGNEQPMRFGTPAASAPAPQTPAPGVNASGSNAGSNGRPGATGGAPPNGAQFGQFRRAVQPVQAQVQNARPPQPVTLTQAPPPGQQGGTPMPHRSQLNGIPPNNLPTGGTPPRGGSSTGNPSNNVQMRTNQGGQPLAPKAKAVPPTGSGDEKTKEKDKDKDKKE